MTRSSSRCTSRSPMWLLLLLLLPAWWWLAPPARRPAIVFSRADVLAARPARGRGVARALALLRNLALARAHRRARAAAHGRARGERDHRRDQHRHRDRPLELDARRGLPAAEPPRGREGQGQAVHPGRHSDRIGARRVRGRGAHAGAAHRRTIPCCSRRVDNLQAGPARGRHRDRDGDRHGREPAARRARPVEGDHPAHRRREQSRLDRSAHRGAGGGAVGDEDLHDRRRHRRDGAGAGGTRALGLRYEMPPGGDR